ncbi:SusF/SusE family outer membrane protein [Bacteroides ovatus]|uniref:SusF/SusE family outer membrane protein n=1 Tax=Bacteroides ovatus TaxID=28116 RepID=UPI0018970ABA|nr:SusF/SusE family outer membrane protein [Bacteroides ovatus]MDC2624422.1 SusF/SusE family outer membrane protein [Bacteroides ovatus]MDC2638287.1 SusF/SusE family outer membrane protein [Bacteroides ovatus]MDC2652846.1 SusF/SusE family outer membrane protein [Bacteroides ovatus]
MKTILKLLMLLFITMCSITSCDDDDNHLPTGDALTISVPESSIVLTQDKRNETAVVFTWNKGLDRGEGTSITYCFEMDLANNNFETAIPLEELGPDVFEKSFTVRELNELVLNYWKQEAYGPVKLEAKVIARVEADKFIKPEVSKITINVTPYYIYTMPIYIFGDATSAGWDVAQAIQMTEIDPGIKYSYKGTFTAGEYRFIEGQDSEIPTYERGNTENNIIFVEKEQSSYNNFKIEKDGKHEVTINIVEGTHEVLYYPEYERVFMVGDATPNGWPIEKAYELIWTKGTDEFVYEGLLNTGRLKFPLDVREWSTPFLMPMTQVETDLSKTEVQVVPTGGVDNQWEITEAAFYRITLNLSTMTIHFKKYGELVYPKYRRIFMVGDATPNGWKINDAYEFKWQINTSLFVFEGYLNKGEMKFPLEERDWGSAFLMPEVKEQKDLSATEMQEVAPGGVDNKWIITDETKGNYKLTLDVENMTIKFEKK